jgi:uncharacterized membrane protein SpoIIM required for sporulation/ABC-type transport system involved in multi-copper enzyme maturation permease subunit
VFKTITPALIVARREVLDQFRDWRIVFPIIFLTLFFPFLMNFTAQQIMDLVNQYGANIIGERMVPFLLMIVGFFPISTSLVIALESFVGEKERGSIEPLLSSPILDWQLYLGKLISSTIPPLMGSFLGMAVYLISLYVSHVQIPESALLLQILVLTIAQAIVMVAGAVVVSSQATSVKAANLLASFIVIPMALLVQGEAMVMFWGRDTLSLWWIVFGLLMLAALLVRVGLAHFQREELLGREIDVLNIRWGWRTFKHGFSGGAGNIREWYRESIPASLRKLRWSILAAVILIIFGLIVGARQTNQFPIQLSSIQMGERLKTVRDILPMSSAAPVLMILWQNSRTIIISLLLGICSFGILGVMPAFATMGMLGYLVQTLANNGISPQLTIAGLILPHAIFEIPALILATAAILQNGLLLATPISRKTVGEVFLSSVGEWLRIFIGIVLPLLIIAAFIEAWITPRIGLLVFN